MLAIRLMRFGRKHQPFFRLVVVPKRGKPARAKYIEALGWVNPVKHEHRVDAERVKYWMGVGAQPSVTVWNLFVREGIVEGPKRPIRRTQSRRQEAAERANETAGEGAQPGAISGAAATTAETDEKTGEGGTRENLDT